MKIEVSGCINCPFKYENDMGFGYVCKIDAKGRTINQSKKYLPITPEWCPVKSSSVVVTFKTMSKKGCR